MRRLLPLILGVSLLTPPLSAKDDDTALVSHIKTAVALLYSQSADGTMQMLCTATAFDKTYVGYLFVSAAHCVGSDDTTHERSANAANTVFYVTFDEAGREKKFYPAEVKLVGYQHRGEDFSVFEVAADANAGWEMIPLGDEKKEKDGAAIVNVASPQGLGKQVFHGTISSMYLDRPVVEGDINWRGTLLLQIQSGPGSSGSAIVSEKQEAIIGFLVGTVAGNNIVAIPVSRFKAVREAVKDGKYSYYKVPEKEK